MKTGNIHNRSPGSDAGDTAVLPDGSVVTISDFFVDDALNEQMGLSVMAGSGLKCPDCGSPVTGSRDAPARFVHNPVNPTETPIEKTGEVVRFPRSELLPDTPGMRPAHSARSDAPAMFGVEKDSYTFFRSLIERGLSQRLVGAVLFDTPKFLNGLTVHEALGSQGMVRLLMDRSDHYLTGEWARRSAVQDHQTNLVSRTE